MKTFRMRKVKIGSGMAKICIPIVDKNREDIVAEVSDIKKKNADIIEWRADFFEKIGDVDEVLQTAEEIRKEAGHTPVIFTIRTFNEGGNIKIDNEKYIDTICKVVDKKVVDAVDIEICKIGKSHKDTIKEIKSKGCKVILSYHNFKDTPYTSALEKIVESMRIYKPDIYKIAVMALNRDDLLRLMKFSIDIEEYINKPKIIISMGKWGIASRVCSEIFGSAITFATLDKESAPGQIEFEKMKSIISMIHNSLE